MMRLLRLGPRSLLATMLAFTLVSSAIAQDTYRVGIDTDLNGTAGCDFDLMGAGPTIAGVDLLLVLSVDPMLVPPMVVDSQVLTCNPGTNMFENSMAVGPIPWPVGLDVGVPFSGGLADVVEGVVPASKLGNVPVVRLAFLSVSEAGAVDALFTRDGTPTGPAIIQLLDPAAPAPLLSPWAMVLLIAIFLAIAFVQWRRTGALKGSLLLVTLFVGLTGVAYALQIVVDGDVSDWGGAAPNATDLPSDAMPADPLAEILATFNTADAGDLYVRLDIAGIQAAATATPTITPTITETPTPSQTPTPSETTTPTQTATVQMTAVTFNYTGSLQTFTVPQGVSSITIDASGAQGGSVTTTCAASGGLGARIVGDVAVTPGEVLDILVGEQGSTNGSDAGGGGGSFVVRTGNVALVVAGGGGGATNNIGSCGANRDGIAASITTSGTASGNGLVAGGTNGNGGGASSGSGGGGGGFLTDGVAGTGLANNNGKAYVNGGAGGTGNNNDRGGFGGGGAGWFTGGNGGGGGGYSGGGTSGSQPFTGGGGGGSFNSGTNQSNTAGFQSGNGRVILTWGS